MNEPCVKASAHAQDGTATLQGQPTLSFYLYYKVTLEQAPTLALRVQQMQAQLRQSDASVLSASLHSRVEQSPAPLQTWMEIYHCLTSAIVPHPFLHSLQQATLEADILAFIQGERHLECFMEIDPCA